MRRISPHIALAVAGSALLLVTGCGTQTGTAGAGSVAASPSPSPSSPSSSATKAGCKAETALTAADNNSTVCVTKGGQIRLTLDGTADKPWAAVEASGGALTPVNAGIGAPVGDRVSAYRASSDGKVTLTSSRPMCAKAKPGQMQCKALMTWMVTVVVS
ncbi:hypothetical protein OG607_23620 [Streptomyces sp. NBC_01537]|uniref:hypothetical protein n=1 Tax=Streptomyces sp. NBC_01537 TaxID=2903896 RepID=UPI00386C32D6